MIIFLLLFFTIVLQIAIVSQFKILGAIPNLVLIVLLLIFLLSKTESSWAEKKYKFFTYAAAAGLILDFFSGLPFGVIVSSLILCFFLIGFLWRIISTAHINLLTLGVLLFAATLIYDGLLFFLTHFGLFHFFDYAIDSRLFFFRTAPIEIIYNILLGLFVFYPVRNLLGIFRTGKNNIVLSCQKFN